MKNILTFVGGGDRDPVILQTALAAAIPLSAHLDCLHFHVPATQAARYANTEFAVGAALRNALDRLETNANIFSELAAEHVRALCTSARIEMCDAPAGRGGVTASFREEESNALERLVYHASRTDLLVMGRARQKQGLAPETLEHLAMNCGRPILVAASVAPQTLTDTVMVCWNDSASATRAVTAATPLLGKAKRVLFVSVAGHDGGVRDALNALAKQFAGTGVSAEVRVISAPHRRITESLSTAAEECGANLVVMGAYGRSRLRELIFGSHTEALLDACDRPMLLMH